MSQIRLPIGIQNFESLRRDGYVYVDKTRYLYELVHGDGRAFFLSRPRRFGKSMLLSTLRAYWEGKKELFAGLAVEQLEREREDAQMLLRKEKGNVPPPLASPEIWEAHPVFYFDFNKKNFRENAALETILDEHLRGWEKEYGVADAEAAGNIRSLEERFRKLIEKAYEVTGRRVVVLVDEYDKPLLENSGGDERIEHDKALFKGFFSTLKSYDEFIRFSFLTGVTKFSKVSIFSDLNHLYDLTIDEEFACICGMTEAEIRAALEECVAKMAAKNALTVEECYAELRKMYDGYHFHQNSEGVYNPYSLLTALKKKEFGAWWFETGTPTYLVQGLKKINYDIRRITDGEVYASEAKLKDYRDDNPDPVPLLFQSGYLTITSYDKEFRSYQLAYPNEEVKYGFLESLAVIFLSDGSGDEPEVLDIRSFGIDIKRGNTDGLRDRLTALYASLPYPAGKNADRQVEQNFQNVAYLVFTLLGQFVRTEVHSSKGRSDVVVETEDFVYLMEFKRDRSAQEALAQIREKGYATPYTADSRTIIRIGANFDSASGTLDDWKVEEESTHLKS